MTFVRSSAAQQATVLIRYIKSKYSKTVPLRHESAKGGGEEIYILILDFGSRWAWVVSVTPRPRFASGERTPGTHYIEVWAGLRASLDTEARGKIPFVSAEDRIPVVHSVVRHC
jgi:hypothetical protein